MSKTVVLLILDGWGARAEREGNAIISADTPVIDRLNREHPYVTIHASGKEVGLPTGQMGNSEVGHLNIGAGRVVYQDLLRINRGVKDGTLFDNKALAGAMERAVKSGSALHLCGLLSDGGVHSHIEHLFALLEMARRKGLERVFIHPFTDGRDTPPDSGLGYVKALEKEMERVGVGRIATIQGRFHAMDRDNRWDRIKKAYNAMTQGVGQRFGSATEAMEASYQAGVTDEFVEPCVITNDTAPAPGMIRGGDEVVMFNFRADRMRQIVRALYDKSFGEFARSGWSAPNLTCMAQYDIRFGLPVAFAPTIPKNGLAQVLADNGMTQLRTAETEKYAHVTFFFNGGVERAFANETRKLTASPRVRTYDLQPEMSCPEVTDTIVKAVESGQYNVIVANLANGDMVGHTGIWESAIKAVNVIDRAVGRIMKACAGRGAHLLITADHGNIETMLDNGKPMTAHTTNPVPFYYLGNAPLKLRENGRLADIAPTILKLVNLPQPDEMTGSSLLV